MSRRDGRAPTKGAYVCVYKDNYYNQVSKFRAQTGLRALEPCKLLCLKCEKPFKSMDKRINKVCNSCKGGEDFGHGI